MESYVWNKRPLLVVAPDPESPTVRAQRAALADAVTGFRARDMVLIEVLDQAVWIDGVKAKRDDAAALSKRYDVAEAETAVLLVGKDGGVKQRRSGVLEPRDLFGLIDTMPMRQREMRTDSASQ
jgi:hypothetical protein